MALTYTPAGSPEFKLPPFALPGVDGSTVDLAVLAQKARATLIAFVCGHCPYVLAIERRLIELAAEFKPAGLLTVAICANDPADHEADQPAALLARWREQSYDFPYAIDHAQEIARRFGAVCTPDFFLFDADRTLRYRGRLDDSWRDPAKVRARELASAVTAVLRGTPVAAQVHPSMGCSIKWRA